MLPAHTQRREFATGMAICCSMNELTTFERRFQPRRARCLCSGSHQRNQGEFGVMEFSPVPSRTLGISRAPLKCQAYSRALRQINGAAKRVVGAETVDVMYFLNYSASYQQYKNV